MNKTNTYENESYLKQRWWRRQPRWAVVTAVAEASGGGGVGC